MTAHQPPTPHRLRESLITAGLAAAAGVIVCACVLAGSGARLPWNGIIFLSIMLALLRKRSIWIRRHGPNGEAGGSHHMGDSMILIAAMHYGPAAALSVHLLSGVYTLPGFLRGPREYPARIMKHLFCFPAMSWAGASVYYLLGGHAIRNPADSALFFQSPTRALLPMLAMMFTQYDLLNRPLQAITLYFAAGIPIRRSLTDPLLAVFDYMEFLSGSQILVLWNAWGWATLPFSLISNEAYILGVRSYLERREIQWHARRDPLTGLMNWHGLEAALRARLQTGEPFALLFLDVDGLKRVNDSLGHQAGDELLKLVGEIIRTHINTPNTVARRSGDEFIVILPGANRSAAEKTIASLQAMVQERFARHVEFHIAGGVSAGVAVCPNDGRDVATLMEYADSQMYHNKRIRRVHRAALSGV